MLQSIQESANFVSVDFVFFFSLSLDLALIEWPGPTLHQFETARPGKLPFTVPCQFRHLFRTYFDARFCFDFSLRSLAKTGIKEVSTEYFEGLNKLKGL